MPEPPSPIALPILLALEPVAGEHASRSTLTRDEASELAARVAADLQVLVPLVGTARLALAGALFDPVELLRPGFPVWTVLDELARRVPRGQRDDVIAFGSHDGRMPAPLLEPAAQFADGPMRLLPLSLLASATEAGALAAELEVQLVGRGEAGERTADWLMRTLGMRLEHVRYLSRNDLLALTCVQYEHVNLAAMWAVLEAALLSPGRPESALSARGMPLQYIDGSVHMQAPSLWLAAQAGELAQRAHLLAGIVFELRQHAALLEAHGLPLRLQQTSERQVEAGEGYLLETLSAALPGSEPPAIFAHEAPGLGVIALTVAQAGSAGEAHLLAHAWPLRPQALGSLLALLVDRHAAQPELHALGRVLLDARGRLSAPGVSLR